MKRPVRILQVVHSLIVGGTERVVCDLARAFNDGEFRTSVCCLDGLGEFGEELRNEGIRVHVLDRKPGLDLSLTLKLRDIYRQDQIDFVHAHQYTPYFYAALAAFRAGLLPVIFTEHGRHWPDRLRIKRAIANQFLRMTTPAYTAVSDFSRQSLVRYEKIPGRAIQVIYNGIRLNGARHDANDRERIRQEAGINSQDLLVLSVGRLDPIKDFATLIRAFASVVRELPNAFLWIAGDGDATYKQSLEQLVGELGLSQNVKFLGTRRDVESLLDACDLFALSSITEASSMTVLEAMAMRRAVLATCTGGNPELVIPGDTGMLVPVGDVSAMAEAMLRLLKDPEQRERMGRNGSQKVKNNFSWDLSLAQYRDLYRSISGKKQGSSFHVWSSLFTSHI
jgi:sugar transferase (PEP-CTERM/EpsH1 system associated)